MIQSTNEKDELNIQLQKNLIAIQKKLDKKIQQVKELEDHNWFLKAQLDLNECLRKLEVERYQQQYQQQQNGQNNEIPREFNHNELNEAQNYYNLQINRSIEFHNEISAVSKNEAYYENQQVEQSNLNNNLGYLSEVSEKSIENDLSIAEEHLKAQQNQYEPDYESNRNPQKQIQPKVKISNPNPLIVMRDYQNDQSQEFNDADGIQSSTQNVQFKEIEELENNSQEKISKLYIEESKIIENKENESSETQRKQLFDELFNLSQIEINLRKSTFQSILSQEPSNKKIRKVVKKELSRFSNALTRNVYQLSKEKKQTVICYNDHDNKIIVGQNETNTLIFDSEMQDMWLLELDSELISIYQINGLFFFGMNDKKVIIFEKDQYDEVKRIDTIKCVQKFVYYQHEDPNLNLPKEYLILLEKEGYIQFFSFQEKQIVSTHQHSSLMSIQDGLQVANKNQLCLACNNKLSNSQKNLAQNQSFSRRKLS
ncbi:UNKNOWN [Stylonychia lemnae]|uniref:Uncharacterized protein n=1 Tax=Stylonychia lemnae TaxID=5949 RepID=A0A078B2C7_STYLE|nr:UNKNOWN [Stylonychia lemnae]|eukprot:CDW87628.1 UNKNOWN [Stylonychia lemnae]